MKYNSICNACDEDFKVIEIDCEGREKAMRISFCPFCGEPIE